MPDLEAIRARDARWLDELIVNSVGSPLPATQDRRDLLTLVDTLTRELNAERQITAKLRQVLAIAEAGEGGRR